MENSKEEVGLWLDGGAEGQIVSAQPKYSNYMCSLINCLLEMYNLF